ncbi:MAG: bifunctional aspartate kinase/diaminopimelate decarboxylase [Xanthomonadales bacterium]|nr:bifunctional aspartate kinase/diaminopimelate decarboxylase [Xanthomonadales bacterium]
MKFGGTSVANAASWSRIRSLMESRRREGGRVLVVVSAVSGVTDALRQLGKCAERGDREAAAAAIARRHRELLQAMQLAEPAGLTSLLAELAELAAVGCQAAEARAYQARTQAFGELLSSTLGAAFLDANGWPTRWLDAREHLCATALPNQNLRTRMLSAMVAPVPDPALAAQLAAQGDAFITQGFIARDGDGHTVLLGRGGSDTSAACFGALLGAQRVEIWTDVAGMFTANPRQVPGARLLRRLDYEEAQEIASTGAKVLHPHCLQPLREPRVPLLIKDTNRPELEGTVIGPEVRTHAPSVKAISARKGITLVSMESVGMWQQVGFLADVFAYFKTHGLSVDLIGSAETNVTVSLDPTENLLDSDAIAALATDLAKVCRVKVIAPCAAITLVGRGIRSLLHTLSDVLAEFGHLRVHLISQSSNNLNLTFVVDEGVVDTLLPHLHELLIAAGSLRTDDDALFGPSWQTLYGTGDVAASVPAWWQEHGRERLLALAHAATPRYAYHLPTVLARVRALQALDAVDRWHYAVKANPHPAILRALAAAGCGFECGSPGELRAVAAAAPDAAGLLYIPSFAARGEFAFALGTRAVVTLDTLYPLQHWGELFRDREIMLRLDLGRDLGDHGTIRGGDSGKFGLPLDQLPTFLQLAQRHGARVAGLHAHAGTGVLDADHWGRIYAQLASLAEHIGSVSVLDVGGGLGVPAHPGERGLDLDALGRTLHGVKAAYPQYQLWMEPGRYLVAEAGVLLARVTQLRTRGKLHYLGLDAGMDCLIRPALDDSWHRIVNLTRLAEPTTVQYQVVGPICDSSDILGRDRRLPEAREGDVVLIAQVGAYGKAMASRYNLRDEADEVVIE